MDRAAKEDRGALGGSRTDCGAGGGDQATTFSKLPLPVLGEVDAVVAVEVTGLSRLSRDVLSVDELVAAVAALAVPALAVELVALAAL